MGGALAFAALATVSSSHGAALARSGAASPQALTGGFHLAIWIAAALVGIALAVAVAVVPRPATTAMLEPATADAA